MTYKSLAVHLIASAGMAIILSSCGNAHGTNSEAVFSDFSYKVILPEGSDTAQTEASPLLHGCYPDPSIVRVGDDYYMVNSSFAYFPGVPIWHSTDLRSWERLGYVLSRREQLSLPDSLRISGGIYAPDIAYNPHNRLFYMITTLVDNGGNFYVTCTDPRKGDWSDPVWLPEVGGIDPSLLFDTDGKAYIVNNDSPEGSPLYEGHRAIHLHEFDWERGCVTGESKVIVNGGVDITEKPVWIEGPHLYHIGDKYFLMCAEGGTGPDHREVIFESGSPKGPFRPCDINPILTQKDLDPARPNPVTCAGHADLVEDTDGQWWSVFLAVRPYADGHDVMGRETYLHPVTWRNGQPVITEPGEILTPHPATETHSNLWNSDTLANDAFFIRNGSDVTWSITPAGDLQLKSSPVKFADKRTPSAIGRWVTENAFVLTTTLDSFTPESEEDLAGLFLFQDDGCNITFGKSADTAGSPCVKVTASCKGKIVSETSAPLSSASGPLTLRITADGDGFYHFETSTDGNSFSTVGEPISADILSTRTAGNFTGTVMGLYVTASGK